MLKRTVISIGVSGCFLLGFMYLVIHQFMMHDFSSEKFFHNDQYIRQLIHEVNYKFSYYDDFLTTVASDFDTKDKYEKCNIFLKYMDSKQPEDWRFPIFRNGYNKDIDKMSNYMEGEFKRLLEKRKKNGLDGNIPNIDKLAAKEKFFEVIDNTLKVDQEMGDAIQILRVYNQCFLRDMTSRDGSKHFPIDHQLWNKWSKKLYHYLNFESPEFQIYDPQLGVDQDPIVFNNGLPDYSMGYFNGDVLAPDVNDKGQKTENLIEFYHKSMNGKGIVITTSARHSRDIAKLIRVLRALNNELPIQIVYRGHLSDSARNLIVTAALEDFSNLVNTSVFGSILPSVDLMDPLKFGVIYPYQKLSFMNVKGLIKDGKMFQSYNNKVITTLFSSFKEIILMDADTVPLVEPSKLFQSDEYLATSSLFFKDRSLRDTNDYLETNYFKRLMPLNDRKASLDRVLGLPEISPLTFKENNFMQGWRHFQEAGVVTINKQKHFGGMLMMLPLAMWREPIKTSVWGDKEFYWLGPLMNGDDQISFNQYEASSVGVASPVSLQLYGKGSGNEVCSTHPGHVDRHGTLLWINSGFSYCKKNNYYRDKEKYPFSKLDGEELSGIYENPLKITHAIVPPLLPPLRQHGEREWDVTPAIEFIRSWKQRTPDVDEIKDFGDTKEFTEKLDYLPQKGWVKSGICSGYYYCAYDEIESYNRGESNQGKFFKFDKELVDKYDYLGKLWITAKPRV